MTTRIRNRIATSHRYTTRCAYRLGLYPRVTMKTPRPGMAQTRSYVCVREFGR